MGTASIGATRDAIKVRLETILGLHCYDVMEGQVESPAAVVCPDNGAYDAVMGRGADDFVMLVSLAISAQVDRTAQDTLDGYLDGAGATSIKAAIEGERTLGGLVSYARVPGWRNYGSTPVNGVRHWGADVIVEVRT